MTLIEVVMHVAFGVMFLVPIILVVYPHYRENWPQWIGLTGISLSSVSLLGSLHGHRSFSTAAILLLSGSVASYLFGVLCKVIKHRPRKSKSNEPPSAAQLPTRN